MTKRRRTFALLRLTAALCLALALVGGEAAHGHASFSSPELCATCSFSTHAPTVLVAAIECGHAPQPSFTIGDHESAPAARVHRTPTRSRAPPFA